MAAQADKLESDGKHRYRKEIIFVAMRQRWKLLARELCLGFQRNLLLAGLELFQSLGCANGVLAPGESSKLVHDFLEVKVTRRERVSDEM